MQTLPRGESGPEAGDGSVAQNCSSVLPRRNPHRFRRGSCFQNQNTGISFRACPRSENAKTPRRAFGAGAFLMDFVAGYLVVPTQRSILSRPRQTVPSLSQQQHEKHGGKYPENGAGKDCEPLQFSFGNLQEFSNFYVGNQQKNGGRAAVGSTIQNLFHSDRQSKKIFVIPRSPLREMPETGVRSAG